MHAKPWPEPAFPSTQPPYPLLPGEIHDRFSQAVARIDWGSYIGLHFSAACL